MTTKTGQIKVNTTDIFPIIKKWLYSEHDIFLRELVSNACDAITKRKTIARTQNIDAGTGEVLIEVDKTAGTITIQDDGFKSNYARLSRDLHQSKEYQK